MLIASHRVRGMGQIRRSPRSARHLPLVWGGRTSSGARSSRTGPCTWKCPRPLPHERQTVSVLAVPSRGRFAARVARSHRTARRRARGPLIGGKSNCWRCYTSYRAHGQSWPSPCRRSPRFCCIFRETPLRRSDPRTPFSDSRLVRRAPLWLFKWRSLPGFEPRSRGISSATPKRAQRKPARTVPRLKASICWGIHACWMFNRAKLSAVTTT